MSVVLSLVIVAAVCGPAAAAPRDFTAEARALFAVAACGEAPPAGYDAAVVSAHCKELAKPLASWRKHWRDLAAPFFQALLGGKYPQAIVYPFGGGDLSTLLVVYPDATEYTTLSLEGMGDPRPIASLGGPADKDAAARGKKLAAELAKIRRIVGPNLGWAWNTTIQLSIDSSETGLGLPGILTLALVALEVNGYEPLETRFFTLGDRGAIDYLDAADVEAWDAAAAAARRGRKATHAVQQGAFNNVEIVFRKKGDPGAARKTFRHITGDLSDAGLAKHAAPLEHLAQKRDIAAMTKAASYLLWKPEFSKVRDYLLASMKHMISDDTGIPPRYARPAGFASDVWGTYTGPYFAWARGPVATEMVQLFRGNQRRTPFRFGYYDAANRPVLMHVHK
ncbi:MAG TPA: hypothetical protein VK932_30810 [Kofleriaceae bacterium]|nr:hypothetical protein [Kofleriaceae bacterium]